MNAPHFGRVVVVGVGLIGASFALAGKRAGLFERVIGVGRSRANLEQAQAMGAIDAAAGDAGAACADADLVFLATPVGQLGALMRAIAPRLGARTIVTDAGSTKADVVALAREHLGAHLARFVPAHPIAGGDRSGAAAADPELYRARRVVLTPLEATDPAALAAVRATWEALGAQVSLLSPERHDRVYAAVSHLPHLLMFALVDAFARRDDGSDLFAHAGRGLSDTTRIAGGSPEMWRDISLANRAALLAELDAYTAALARARAMLAQGDGAALEALYANARRARLAWMGGAAGVEG
ncbi:MAG: prephenate dehydrogenase/arogenate dehydrogenase family protein [Burkholderiales bacterium]|nr:prephenate dehydrogenase/arogenate dehydrogenase family protein [Burkholderiales bacterium]